MMMLVEKKQGLRSWEAVIMEKGTTWDSLQIGESWWGTRVVEECVLEEMN